MPAGDFSIPTGVPDLRPDFTSYNELAGAQQQAQQARAESVAQIAQAAKTLFTIGQDSAFVNMQTDILHMKMDITQKAIDLVAQGPGKGFTYEDNLVEPGTGEQPGKSMVLNPAFQEAIDAYQKTLTEKYKNYPAVQRAALESFDSTVLEAHKQAYAAATKDALQDGKNGIVNFLDIASLDGIKNRSTSIIDAKLDNPTTRNFFTPNEIEAMRYKYHKTVSDGVFSADLVTDVKTAGVNAALARLADRKDLTDQQKASYENDIRRVDALEQGAVNSSVLSKANDLVGKGISVFDAVNQASTGVPDFRMSAAQDAAKSYLTARQDQFDKDARGKVTDYAQQNGWAATKTWFMDPANKQFSMSGDGFQSELAYIDARIADEKATKTDIANRIPKPLLMIATSADPQKEDKGTIFRKAFMEGWKGPDGKTYKIDGEELMYLEGHRVDNDTTLSEYNKVIGSWSDVNPVTGKTLMPHEQSALGMMMLNQEYRRLLQKGPVSEADLRDTVNDIKAFLMDSVINKAVNQQFTTTSSFLPFIKWDDVNAIQHFQNLIQTGQVDKIAGLDSFQANLDELRKGQLNLLAPIAKNGKFKIIDAKMADNGQQFFYDSNGRTVAYIKAKDGQGKDVYKWVSAKTGSEPKTFDEWQDLK